VTNDLDLLRAQRSVWKSSLSADCKLVALALLDHWSASTETYPGIDRLCGWASLSRSTVIRCIAELERVGAIVVKRETGHSNRYALGQLSLLPVSAGHPCQPDTGLRETPVPVPGGHPTRVSLTPKGTQQGTQQGTHTDARDSGSPMKGAQKRKRQRQPETAMPVDWQPTEAHRKYAAKHGLQFQFELDSFRGWAEGRTAVSWNGTFTTRLANQAKWNRERGAGRSKPVLQRGGEIREGDSSWLDAEGAAE